MKTQYYTAATLDGFIATLDDSLDWLFSLGDIGATGRIRKMAREVFEKSRKLQSEKGLAIPLKSRRDFPHEHRDSPFAPSRKNRCWRVRMQTCGRQAIHGSV
jgi:hypothetical protein